MMMTWRVVGQVAVGRRPHLSVFGKDYNTPDGTGVRDYIHVMVRPWHEADGSRMGPDFGCCYWCLVPLGAFCPRHPHAVGDPGWWD
jgi:hypothetical protein